TVLSTANVSALSRWSKAWIWPLLVEISFGVPPACLIAFHGSVSSTCSTPSGATRNAIVLSWSMMNPPSRVVSHPLSVTSRSIRGNQRRSSGCPAQPEGVPGPRRHRADHVPEEIGRVERTPEQRLERRRDAGELGELDRPAQGGGGEGRRPRADARPYEHDEQVDQDRVEGVAGVLGDGAVPQQPDAEPERDREQGGQRDWRSRHPAQPSRLAVHERDHGGAGLGRRSRGAGALLGAGSGGEPG